MRRAACLCLVAALSCVGYDAGIDVDVELAAPRATFGNGVQSATLLIESLELLPCEGSARGPLVLGAAYAHGGDVAVDVVDVLETPRRSLATLRPAPDDYCTLRLHLGDADRDAATMVHGDEALSAPRQDVDIEMSPRSFLEVGQHDLVLHYDYTQWVDAVSFANSFRVAPAT